MIWKLDHIFTIYLNNYSASNAWNAQEWWLISPFKKYLVWINCSSRSERKSVIYKKCVIFSDLTSAKLSFTAGTYTVDFRTFLPHWHLLNHCDKYLQSYDFSSTWWRIKYLAVADMKTYRAFIWNYYSFGDHLNFQKFLSAQKWPYKCKELLVITHSPLSEACKQSIAADWHFFSAGVECSLRFAQKIVECRRKLHRLPESWLLETSVERTHRYNFIFKYAHHYSSNRN